MCLTCALVGPEIGNGCATILETIISGGPHQLEVLEKLLPP
jgi:hypothetical protein